MGNKYKAEERGKCTREGKREDKGDDKRENKREDTCSSMRIMIIMSSKHPMDARHTPYRRDRHLAQSTESFGFLSIFRSIRLNSFSNRMT